MSNDERTSDLDTIEALTLRVETLTAAVDQASLALGDCMEALDCAGCNNDDFSDPDSESRLTYQRAERARKALDAAREQDPHDSLIGGEATTDDAGGEV